MSSALAPATGSVSLTTLDDRHYANAKLKALASAQAAWNAE